MHTHGQFSLEGVRLERSGVPIYVQLREHVVRAVATGALAPGARMPTMRQVAVALKIDLNTVRHAYEDLERLGVLVLVHGRGSFVAEGARAEPGGPVVDPLDLVAAQALKSAADLGADAASLINRIAAMAALVETRS